MAGNRERKQDVRNSEGGKPQGESQQAPGRNPQDDQSIGRRPDQAGGEQAGKNPERGQGGRKNIQEEPARR